MDESYIQKLGISEKLELYNLEKEYIQMLKPTFPLEITDDDVYISFVFPERWYEWDDDTRKIEILRVALANNKNVKHYFEIPDDKLKK